MSGYDGFEYIQGTGYITTLPMSKKQAAKKAAKKNPIGFHPQAAKKRPS